MKNKSIFSFVVLNFFLFLGLLTLLGVPFFQGKALYFRDIFHNYYPLIQWMKGSLAKGELPFWNPLLFSGTPQMAGLEPALFYPPAWPFFVLNFSSALFINLVSHSVFAAWGLFLFLRHSRLNVWACVVAAISWPLSGSLISLNNMHPLLNTIVWLPWLLLFLRGFALSEKRLRWRYGSLFALAYAFQVLSGHLELVYASSLLIAAYFLLLCFQRKVSWFVAFPFAGFVILGIGLSAIQLIPSLLYQQESARQFGVSIVEAQYFSSHPLMFLNAWITRLSGDIQKQVSLLGVIADPVLKQNLLVSSYLGLVLCIGMIFSLFSHRQEVRFWWLLFLGGGIFALGHYTPIYGLFWTYFPGVSLFRYPEKAWLFLSFFAAVLGAWGLHGFFEANESPFDKRSIYAVFGGILLCGIAGYWFAPEFTSFLRSHWISGMGSTGSEVWKLEFAQHLRYCLMWLMAGSALVLGLLTLLYDGYLSVRTVAIGLTAFAAFDLTYNAQDYFFYTGQTFFDSKPQVASFFDQNLSSQYRYFMAESRGRKPSSFVGLYQNAVLEEAVFRRLYMEDNQGLLFGFASLDGYWPAKPAKSLALRSLYDQGAQYSAFDHIYESLWGARYIVLVAPTPKALNKMKTSPLHQRVAQYEQTLTYVYENKTVLPRVRFQTNYIAVPRLPDMFAIWEAPEKYGYDYTKHLLLLDNEKFQEAKQQVQVQKADVPEWSPPAFLEEHNHSLRIGFETNTSGFLVLADQFASGWRAYDNGQQVPILQANFSQRALRVGPGKHDIRFEYEAPGFAWGWKISLLSGLLLLLVLDASFRQKADLQPSTN